MTRNIPYKKYPVAAYYILTLAISWGGLVLAIGGPDKFSSQPSTTPFLTLYLVTVAGPFLGGLIMTGLIYGKKGYRDFFSRLTAWRSPVKWYAIALLAAPLSVFIALFALMLYDPVFTPGIFSPAENPVAVTFGLPGGDKLGLALFVLMLGLFNGFVEEVGWSGFVTPLLRKDQHLFRSGIVLGVIWGLWHFMSNYLGSSEGAGSIPLLLYLPVMLFSFLPPFRILMVWVYRHTNSLLIAILMHASLDVFWMLSMPVSISGSERMIWYISWAAVLWILAGLASRQKHHLTGAS